MLYHLSLEKINFCKILLGACGIPHVREDGWGLALLFFYQVQDPKCCPGKLGKPAWVLTSVSQDLPESKQPGLSVLAERNPSHSCSLFLLLGGT